MSNKLKAILVIAGLLLLQTAVFAQSGELPVIAVMDFENKGLDSTEVEVINDYVSSALVQTGVYDVIDRSQRNNLLEEIEFSYTGISDEKAQIEIGKLLAADLILVGSIGKVGSKFVLNLSVIDVTTSKKISADSDMYPSIEDLLSGSKVIVNRLVGKVEEHSFVDNSNVITDLDNGTGDNELRPNALLFTFGAITGIGAGLFTYLALNESKGLKYARSDYTNATSAKDAQQALYRFESTLKFTQAYQIVMLSCYAVSAGLFTWGIIDMLPDGESDSGKSSLAFTPGFDGNAMNMTLALSFKY